MRVKFFYRDGDNYKCTFIRYVDSEYWSDFIEMNPDINSRLDREYKSQNLFEIREFGLSINDIPLIEKYGEGISDHPYVSVVSYEEDGEIRGEERGDNE